MTLSRDYFRGNTAGCLDDNDYISRYAGLYVNPIQHADNLYAMMLIKAAYVTVSKCSSLPPTCHPVIHIG